MNQHEVIIAASKSVEHSGGWCSPLKAATLAAITLELRPKIAVEIGVWTGASAIPIMIAQRHLARMGISTEGLIAIDAWSQEVSAQNEALANATWWGSVDHDAALQRFRDRLDEFRLTAFCDIRRTQSDACAVPDTIDLLHVDGSHTDQAVRDVARFGARVRVGGIMIMDDVGWEGGGVDRAIARAKELGFESLYQVDKWLVMERRSEL